MRHALISAAQTGTFYLWIYLAVTDPSIKPSTTTNNVQVKEQQIEQSPIVATASAIYPYSVKVEQTTKGLAAVIVHTYHNDAQTAKDQAVKLFIETRDELKSKGVKHSGIIIKTTDRRIGTSKTCCTGNGLL